MKSTVLKTARALVVPNGLLVIVAAILLHWPGIVAVPTPVVNFYAAAVLVVGGLLAWRFHSSRMFLALAVLALADRALAVWATSASLDSSRALFDLLCVLIPMNLAMLGVVEEAGFTIETLGWGSALIFVQSVAVVVIASSEEESVLHWFERALIGNGAPGQGIPQWGWAAFLVGGAALFVKFLTRRKPVENGLFWCIWMVALGLSARPGLRTAHLATAGLIVIVALVETSYQMAYHDELTSLPARRAFNQALLRLGEDYAIAMVDVDHFKKFNDNYGHDIGDQVLRKVASRLAHVSGEGQAFRCGGEEFAVIFRGRTVEEALPHLEELRRVIASSTFMVRGPDRSHRRRNERRSGHSRVRTRPRQLETSVTVSMGVAEPARPDDDIDDVIRAADKALYKAKDNGRNRVEVAGSRRSSRTLGSAGESNKGLPAPGSKTGPLVEKH